MWAYIPKDYCPSALAQEDLTSESTWLWEMLERSATSNTKLLPSRSWWRACKTNSWMMHLFGQTPRPSTATNGVVAWTDYWRRIPASRSLLPGNGSGQQTRATSGRQSAESSVSASQIGVSSKTWLDTFGSDIGTLFAQTSNALATGSRKASSRRLKSAPLTEGNGSSSWPTATALPGSPTRPSKVGKHNGDSRLEVVVDLWPTPRSEDSESAGNHPGATDSLTGATGLWQTPASDSFRSRGGERKDEMGLDQQARVMWSSPQTHDAKNVNYTGSAYGADLNRDAMHWMTPSANDDAAGTYQPSHLAPETLPHGGESSESTPSTRRQLNPIFVEMLQGWRPGWTSLAPLDCGLPGTGLCQCKQRGHGAPSGDNWPTPDTMNARGGQMRTEAHGKHAMSLHHVVDGWGV